MGSEPNTPYNTLPLLPPGQDIETKAVLKRCVTARAAVAELRRAGELILKGVKVEGCRIVMSMFLRFADITGRSCRSHRHFPGLMSINPNFIDI